MPNINLLIHKKSTLLRHLQKPQLKPRHLHHMSVLSQIYIYTPHILLRFSCCALHACVSSRVHTRQRLGQRNRTETSARWVNSRYVQDNGACVRGSMESANIMAKMNLCHLLAYSTWLAPNGRLWRANRGSPFLLSVEGTWGMRMRMRISSRMDQETLEFTLMPLGLFFMDGSSERVDV